jgi:hypothetical protein
MNPVSQQLDIQPTAPSDLANIVDPSQMNPADEYALNSVAQSANPLEGIRAIFASLQQGIPGSGDGVKEGENSAPFVN